MQVSFNKLPRGWVGVNGPYYMVRAVDESNKREFSQWVMSMENLPKFIRNAEHALKEMCSEVVFYNGLWTKTRNNIMEKANDL